MTTQGAVAGHDEQVHRALSSPVRRRLLELLSDAPQDAHALADRVNLHVNTVRTHLAVLQEAELVASAPEQRDQAGRPRLHYRSIRSSPDTEGAGGYRFLARVLAGQLAATVDDPAAAAEEAGAAWGQFLVDTPAPFSAVDRATAIARVVDLLGEVGFDPELDDLSPDAPRLLLRRCPFLDVAREHQEVVCSIHLGIMRGALKELGCDVVVRDLIPFVEPGLCVSHLQVSS